jgi:7-cyano-7-deazaguanine synthase
MKTVVHLLSGGLDSTVLLYDLKAQDCQVHCLLIDYHQRHVQELEFAKYHCKRTDCLFTVIDLPQFKGSELTDGEGGVVVPNRNAIMLSLGVNLAEHAKAEALAYACNAEDQELFADCRKPFIDAMNAAVKAAGCQVEICAPYLERSKAWIVGRGKFFGVPLEMTWSCYRGGKSPCGQCLACQKREQAFEEYDGALLQPR